MPTEITALPANVSIEPVDGRKEVHASAAWLKKMDHIDDVNNRNS
jgi:hypothetical protein